MNQIFHEHHWFWISEHARSRNYAFSFSVHSKIEIVNFPLVFNFLISLFFNKFDNFLLICNDFPTFALFSSFSIFWAGRIIRFFDFLTNFFRDFALFHLTIFTFFCTIFTHFFRIFCPKNPQLCTWRESVLFQTLQDLFDAFNDFLWIRSLVSIVEMTYHILL